MDGCQRQGLHVHSPCGVLAIAYAFDICSGLNPCEVRFDHSRIRQHLATCLESARIARFPTVGERESESKKPRIVKLHCSCFTAEQNDEMVTCAGCRVRYHRHCENIPSEVKVHWLCDNCKPRTK